MSVTYREVHHEVKKCLYSSMKEGFKILKNQFPESKIKIKVSKNGDTIIWIDDYNIFIYPHVYSL